MLLTFKTPFEASLPPQCVDFEFAMNSTATRFVKACVRLIPIRLRRATLRSAALVSPAIKTKAFEQLCCAIARASFPNSTEMWLTNLGVSPKLRCKMPVTKDRFVFGRPQNSLSERATLALASELCSDCTHFVDVGANDGIFTFVVDSRTARHLRLHWFEPDNTLYARLQANLAANTIPALGNCAAVAAARGTARFFKNPAEDSSGSLVNDLLSDPQRVAEEVNTISLFEYFRLHDIRDAIVKVDVEGAGDQVWRGARQVAGDMRYLIMEILGPETACALPSRVISEGNFHAYYIRDFDLIFSKDGSYRYVAPFWNWLFCRLDPELLRERLSGTRFHVISN
jgi:FkbM family methyltransferase